MLTLYNTRTKQKEVFTPIKDNEVSLYTCGPTVYNYAHIGNLRTYVFEDILRRVLMFAKYNVNHVMNITDVGHLTDNADAGEDKMEKGSKRDGKSASEIATFYTEAFKKDMKDLHLLMPTTLCAATDHIPEQILQVQTLIDNGYTYETNDGIYFDTTKIEDYGKLANLKGQELQAGVRVELGEKKNLHDFALWKFTKPGETRQMEWEAFGKKGFPGWHIECSAMSMKYLGNHFDIHCGGIDHIPVHHTNEIAQAEAAGANKPWVNFWLHGEFLNIKGAKMSKSDDNFLRLQTILDKGISPLSYRYFLLQAHYRKQLVFSWEALEAADNGLKNLRKQIALLTPDITTAPEVEDAIKEALYDDLNTAEALGLLSKHIKTKTISREIIATFDEVFALDLLEAPEPLSIPEDIEVLIEERKMAREQKDWKKSDDIRNLIQAKGFLVEDTIDGQTISLS